MISVHFPTPLTSNNHCAINCSLSIDSYLAAPSGPSFAGPCSRPRRRYEVSSFGLLFVRLILCRVCSARRSSFGQRHRRRGLPSTARPLGRRMFVSVVASGSSCWTERELCRVLLCAAPERCLGAQDSHYQSVARGALTMLQRCTRRSHRAVGGKRSSSRWRGTSSGKTLARRLWGTHSCRLYRVFPHSLDRLTTPKYLSLTSTGRSRRGECELSSAAGGSASQTSTHRFAGPHRSSPAV